MKKDKLKNFKLKELPIKTDHALKMNQYHTFKKSIINIDMYLLYLTYFTMLIQNKINIIIFERKIDKKINTQI